MSLRRGFVIAAYLIGAGLAFPGVARAGMPSFAPTDVARYLALSNLTRQRLEAISFFVLVFLLGAALMRWIWNGLRADWPRLPRLSYTKAMGLVALWGLLFLIVLTMISGARELMTPGAWEKRGVTYRLIREPEETPSDVFDPRRFQRIGHLNGFLLQYAEAHRGHFPPAAEIPSEAWDVPGTNGARYIYREGLSQVTRGTLAPLAYEPDEVGTYRFVLWTNGEIRWMTVEELARALRGEAN